MMIKNLSKLNLLLFIMVGLLSVIQVFILNIYSTKGNMQTAILAEIKKQETDNDRLNQKIASFSAMMAVGIKAQDLGLVNKPSLISMTSPLSVALRTGETL